MKQSVKRLLALLLAGTITTTAFVPSAFAVNDKSTKTDSSTSAGTSASDVITASEADAYASLGGVTESAEQSTDVGNAILTGLVNGETEIDVSEYNVSVNDADKAAKAALKETNSTDAVDHSVARGDDGKASTVTLDVSPLTASVIDEMNNGTISKVIESDSSSTVAVASETADTGDSKDTGTSGETASKSFTEEQKAQLLSDWQKYQASITGENAQYFGVQVPYSTTQDTTPNPVGSLMSIARFSYNEEGDYYYSLDDDGKEKVASFEDVDGTVTMFTTANQMAVGFFGEELLAAKDDAMNSITSDMTTEQKLLALNDWLADTAMFDMAYLMDVPAEEPKENQYRSIVSEQIFNGLKEQYADYIAAGYVTEEELKAKADSVAKDILNLWEGEQFGILCPSLGNIGICMGYTNAYNYLVQNAFQEVYKNGDGSWKTFEEINYNNKKNDKNEYVYDPKNTNAMVDSVKINFDTDVTMYGETNEDFTSEHYWSAVQVNGEWYYVDTTYNDIWVECMMRDRVELDGYLNHIYFLISDASARKMFDGYYSALHTLYNSSKDSTLSADKTYEDAWFAFAKTNVTDVNGTWYYLYDSTDLLDQIGQYSSYNSKSRTQTTAADNSNSSSNSMQSDPQLRLVSHDGSASDYKKDAGIDTVYINFTANLDDDDDNDDTARVTVRNPQTGKMVDNEELTEMYTLQKEYEEKYPSVQICADYNASNNLFYFNIANCIYTYNTKSGAVTKIKEYNAVGAARDKSVAMVGNSLTAVAYGSDDAYLNVENPPIASMTIKNGKLVVTLGTNYAFISSPGWRYQADIKNGYENGHYGYEFEETNYNADYVNYSQYGDYGSMMEQMGYKQETNDNQEFMWTANIVDRIAMSDLQGKHNYVEVKVDPTCGRDGYTEKRCETCGAIQSNSRKYDKGTALKHHYVKTEETYYTKDKSSGKYNTGTAYVCTICKDSQETLPEGYTEAHTDKSGDVHFKWSKDFTCKAYMGCNTCEGKALDLLTNADGEPNYTTNADKVEVTFTAKSNNSCEGIYTATATFGTKTYTDTKEGVKHELEKVEAKEATCDEAGNNEYYVCKKCNKAFKDADGKTETTVEDETIAKTTHELEKVEAKEATCDEAGNNEYYVCKKCGKAFKDADGKTETTVEDETIAKIPHELEKVEAKEATCDEAGNNEYYVCKSCGKAFKDAEGKTETTVEDETIAATHELEKVEAKAATRSEDGSNEYYVCKKCGKVFKDANGKTETTVKEQKIAKIASATTKSESYTYSGKKKSPTVNVYDSDKKLISDSNYTLTYKNGRKYVGTHDIVITFNGKKYSGSMTIQYDIKPTATKNLRLTAGSKRFTAKWNKKTTQVTGYQVQYSKYSSFSKRSNAWIASNKTTSTTIKNLSAKKKYYVRVRTYKTVDGKKYYSKWAKVKNVTTKK